MRSAAVFRSRYRKQVHANSIRRQWQHRASAAAPGSFAQRVVQRARGGGPACRPARDDHAAPMRAAHSTGGAYPARLRAADRALAATTSISQASRPTQRRPWPTLRMSASPHPSVLTPCAGIACSILLSHRLSSAVEHCVHNVHDAGKVLARVSAFAQTNGTVKLMRQPGDHARGQMRCLPVL